MFRRLLSLVLALQLLVPTRALTLLTPPPPAPAHAEADLDKETPVPARGCPCTGNAVCKCGGCCSDSTEEGANPAPFQEAPEGEQGKDPSSNAAAPTNGPSSCPQLRCRCNTPESLQPDAASMISARGLGMVSIEPPQIDFLTHLSALWKSFPSSVDVPPPRNMA